MFAQRVLTRVAASSVAAGPGRLHVCSMASLASLSPSTSRFFSVSSKEISYHELKALLKSPPAHFRLVDVREQHEFTAGAIPSAVTVPCKRGFHFVVRGCPVGGAD